MNNLTITVHGWVATEPVLTTGADNTVQCAFRLAVTSRYFDPVKQEWADGNTEWFTVKTARDTAINVKASVRKGQPLIVTGHLQTLAGGHGTDLILAATETRLFHETVWEAASAVLFLRGRLTFLSADGVRAKANAGAPSCLVAYGRTDAEKLMYSGLPGYVVRLDAATIAERTQS